MTEAGGSNVYNHEGIVMNTINEKIVIYQLIFYVSFYVSFLFHREYLLLNC